LRLRESPRAASHPKDILLNQFSSLGLGPKLLANLVSLGFTQPTPIQIKAIPHALAGRDVLGLAQTGTGKTAAFGLPLIELLMKDPARPQPRHARSLILAPTRELAGQIGEHLRALAAGTRLGVRVVVGGLSIGVQTRDLAQGADILVATPGRLLDLVERNAVALGKTAFLVLDEADQMLDLGFIHALRRIAKLVGAPRQTLLFSATMPREIGELSRSFQKEPVRVEAAPSGTTAARIDQRVIHADRGAKASILANLIAGQPDQLSLVFTRTKHGADKLARQLEGKGIAIAAIHGNKSQNRRVKTLAGFRAGDIRVLAATDIAARGIDIAGVTHVYNYDLPDVPETYVHRIGRTARAGAAGVAVAFCSADEAPQLRAIEKLLGFRLAVERPAGHAVRADEPVAGTAGPRVNGLAAGPGAGHPANGAPRPHAAKAEQNRRRFRRRTRRLQAA
jgi:ATP-dependent RNA helicase RhlE